LFVGPCGALNSVQCDDGVGYNDMVNFYKTGLIPGDTAYLKLSSMSSQNFGTFSFLIEEAFIPTNDNCSGAILITPGLEVIADSRFATTSLVDTQLCGLNFHKDLWYKFAVPSSGNVFYTNSYYPSVKTLFTGNCGQLIPIRCSDSYGIIASGLTPGDTVYLMISPYYDFDAGVFNFTIKDAPISGDNCSDATYINLETTVITNNTNATTNNAYANLCTSGTSIDIWFKFIIPPSGNIFFKSMSDMYNDNVASLFVGTCGALNLVACNDNEGYSTMARFLKTGLTPGDTAYLMLSSKGLNLNSYSFIIKEVPVIPNNNCGQSLLVALNDTIRTDNSFISMVSSTAHQCQASSYHDTWYKFVVPASGIISFTSFPGISSTNNVATLFSGNCNSLSYVLCDDNSGPLSMAKFTKTGLTPGDTMYLLLSTSYGVVYGGSYDFIIKDDTIQSSLHPFDDCSTAYQLQNTETPSFVLYNNVGSTISSSISNCDFSSMNDIWYKITMPASGSINLKIIRNTIPSISMAIYSGSNCNNLSITSEVYCIANRYSSLLDTITFTSQEVLIPNQDYYIRIGSTGLGDFKLAYYVSNNSPFVALEEVTNLPNVSLFPNPSSETFSIKGLDNTDNLTVELSSILGQTVASFKNQINFNIEGVAKGMYLVKIKQGNKIALKKLVVD
jgi:hypothetical protein